MEEDIPVRYTFVMLIAIADPLGYVIGTDVAIARRLNMPLQEFERCRNVLMTADIDSNSKEEDGRRIVESDGERGYRVVNYVKYRDMRDEEDRRAYMREYMRRKRSGEPTVVNSVNTCKQKLTLLAKEEADAEAEAKAGGKKNPPKVTSFREKNAAMLFWSDKRSGAERVRDRIKEKIELGPKPTPEEYEEYKQAKQTIKRCDSEMANLE